MINPPEHPILYGAAYYPEHRPADCWEADLDQMQAAHVTCLRVGEFAWCRFEPNPGKYDFEWMDRFMALAARRNIRLLMCPPLRTIPAWLLDQDRGLLIEREDAVVLEYGSRYTFCINHPLLRQKGGELAAAMAAHWKGNPNIAGWHLDNEHGDEPDCHCAICLNRFQQYCKAQHKSVKSLNEQWGLIFWGLEIDKWEQIRTPRVSKTFHAPALLQAWRRFRSACTIEAMAIQADAIRPHLAPGQFITTNNQTWNPRTDYFAMAKHLNVCGTNHYPAYGTGALDADVSLAAVRGYRRANFQVHELRNSAHMIPGMDGNTPEPGEVERLCMHAIANGADALFFFRWDACPFGAEQSHGSIQNFDGSPRRVYPEVQRIGAWLAGHGRALASTSVQSKIALLHDFETQWNLETGAHWTGPADIYIAFRRRLYQAIRRLAFNVDITGPEQDWASYAVLLVPMLPITSNTMADKLLRYVEGGGTLVWHPLCGMKDPDTRIHPKRMHPALAKLTGSMLHEFVTLGEKEAASFTWNGRSWQAGLFCDLAGPAKGAEAIAVYDKDRWFAGAPAIIRNKCGKGECWHVTTFAETPFYSAFIEHLLKARGLSPIIQGPIPENVEVCERSSADGLRLVFLINHGSKPQSITMPTAMQEIYNNRPAAREFELQPHGVAVLR